MQDVHEAIAPLPFFLKSSQGAAGTPLREQVYAHLKLMLNAGQLAPGAFIDLNTLGNDLGLSRTPLRDALLRLEAEGFVTIHSRRGVVVNPLDLTAIRNSYQLLGALEASAIIETGPVFTATDSDCMNELNERMKASLSIDDFDDYYAANLSFHDVYIQKSANAELKRTVRILKERLYDFPRREAYLSEWEYKSLEEHAAIAAMLGSSDFAGAAAYVRDVHWSFAVQERFIMAYYFARETASGVRR
ncbi:MAG: GntR family transcriptional regulator [Spirochaetae bacterium HGW-Spirochaetae-7]|jgi:DNA-binding GntR family transcriptional regulator|nr:MAG: GntR family transcriptional regulator [Spirochaetae bacterium HGW-Spirochaetae-7]